MSHLMSHHDWNPAIFRALRGWAASPVLWRRVGGALVVVLVVTTVVLAQGLIPEADVMLVVDVRDGEAWVILHEEALSTPRELPKPLFVKVPAKTGGSRVVSVDRPRFAVQIVPHPARPVTVIVTGKVTGVQPLRALTLFQQAVLDIQAGTVENHLTFTYGSSELDAQLKDLRLSTP